MDFIVETKKLGLEITKDQLDKFELYYNRLIEVNEYMNLTAITEKGEVYRKHFLDSLQMIKTFDQEKKYTLCDVGSGAGFPSIPLAIVNSNIDVVIIDALNKRINFLNDLVSKLDLNNVKAYHKRAEDYVKEVGSCFDIVTARAVARLNILTELCLPLVKIGGLFIAMKGSSGLDELKEAQKAIDILGGKLVDVKSMTLPDELENREIIIIKKIKETPKKYPRNFSKIKEKPL